MPHDSGPFDVAIIGGGIGGTTLATILARHGVRVLMIENGVHPRFTIGESTVPETTFGLRLIGRRYDVPEIEHLATNTALRRHVSPGSGVKRNFSFCYHREGKPMAAEECTQYPTWGPPLGPDSHFFRQEVDQYLFHTAVRYGATALTATTVTGVEFDDDGATISTERRGEFRASYVIDAGGMRACLPELLGLRMEPTFKTRSRTIYTHMTGVTPFDQVAPPRSQHKMPSPFSEGTLHHLFEGGWFWVIPFDNHDESTNPLCSVGVNLDIDRYPRPQDLSAEDEFWQHVARFPDVARQFEKATAVRPYIASTRTQFQSSRNMGERWLLLPHASDFIDPLFSSGLAVTMFAINGLAHRLIGAATDGDWSSERFAYIGEWSKRMFRYYDDLVATSYISFDDFELWNAWHRVWTLGTLYGANAQNQAAFAFDSTKDPHVFDVLEQAPYRGLQGIDNPYYERLFDSAVDAVHWVRSGEGTTSTASREIYRLIRESGLSPAVWGTLDPTDRCPGRTFTLYPMLKIVLWGKYFAPSHIKGQYFTSGIAAVTRDLILVHHREIQASVRHVRQLTRDSVLNWNRDWRRDRGPARRPLPPRRTRTGVAMSVVPDAAPTPIPLERVG
jgi:FADH2 O2-dependent halogenase